MSNKYGTLPPCQGCTHERRVLCNLAAQCDYLDPFTDLPEEDAGQPVVDPEEYF